jgi:small nuclear ribonucleoprotein D3
MLRWSECAVVSCSFSELKSSVMARGKLEESEDNFNCHLKDVTLTYPDGKETFAPAMFVRGSQIRLIVLPEILKLAPMFKRVFLAKKGKHVAGGLGRGRTEAIRAKGG